MHLVTETIENLTETGIRTKDGQEHSQDVIIYATGKACQFIIFGIAADIIDKLMA